MTAIRNFGMAIGAVGLTWLLWRLNQAIGEQAIILLAGAVFGMLACLPVAVIVWVVMDVRRQPQQDAPQAHEAQPPVLIMLGDGSTSSRSPYQALQGFAAPGHRQVAERDEWMVGS